MHGRYNHSLYLSHTQIHVILVSIFLFVLFARFYPDRGSYFFEGVSEQRFKKIFCASDNRSGRCSH